MPPPRPLTTIGAACLALLLASCGSNGHRSASSSSTSTPGAPAASGPAAEAPAVDQATELKVAPVIHAGSGAAPTKLVIKDLLEGSGAVAQAGSTVSVQYVGALYTGGKVFDSSWTRGQPAAFSLAQVIPGFAQGIAGMKVGGRRELVIPPDLGYGANGTGPIPPNATLVFVIDLLAVQ
ncbi:MAG: FKBP-type peptidyl-prolyl cis-trans isomerase [Acidimicrobiales bacterium]